MQDDSPTRSVSSWHSVRQRSLFFSCVVDDCTWFLALDCVGAVRIGCTSIARAYQMPARWEGDRLGGEIAEFTWTCGKCKWTALEPKRGSSLKRLLYTPTSPPSRSTVNPRRLPQKWHYCRGRIPRHFSVPAHRPWFYLQCFALCRISGSNFLRGN